MNFMKTIMVFVLLTPTLCWGGKFDGALITALSHARAPMVRMSQVRPVRGLEPMGTQDRQFHGAAVLLKTASPKARSMKRLIAERQQQTFLAVEAEKMSFMSRQKNPIHPDPVGEDSTSSASLPDRTNVTQESLDAVLRRQTLENELLKTRLKNLEANLQTEIDRNREGEDQLSPLEMIGVSTGIVAGGCAGLGMVCLIINWFSA